MISGLYDNNGSAYQKYDLDSSYERDEGLLVLPLATNGQSLSNERYKIVTVHAPIGYRIVNWSARKVGSPPLMPSPIQTPSGDTPLGSHIEVKMPKFGSGQIDYNFSASGSYIYIQPNIPRGYDNAAPMNTGWYPFNTDTIVAQLIAAVGGLAGGLVGAALAVLDVMPVRSNREEIQENTAANLFKSKGDKFRYYSPNYSSQLFSGDLIR